jgi:hypothetical protein
MAGGVAVIRPPLRANGTARDDVKRVVVLHDSDGVGCPSTTLGGCAGRAGAVP